MVKFQEVNNQMEKANEKNERRPGKETQSSTQKHPCKRWHEPSFASTDKDRPPRWTTPAYLPFIKLRGRGGDLYPRPPWRRTRWVEAKASPTKTVATSARMPIDIYDALLKRDAPTTAPACALTRVDGIHLLTPEKPKNWASEPVIGMARFQLAMLYRPRHRFQASDRRSWPKAAADFAGYVYAQAQSSFFFSFAFSIWLLTS